MSAPRRAVDVSGAVEARAGDLSQRDVGRQVTLHWRPEGHAVSMLIEGRLHRLVAAEPLVVGVDQPVTIYVDGGGRGGWPINEPIDLGAEHPVTVQQPAEASGR